MIHDLDMARFLVGDEVKSLYVASEALINPSFKESGNVDTAIATLRFRNGALGTIDNSWRATYGYDQRAEILGSNGMYSVENITLPEDKGKEGIHGPLPLAFFQNAIVSRIKWSLKNSFVASLTAHQLRLLPKMVEQRRYSHSLLENHA